MNKLLLLLFIVVFNLSIFAKLRINYEYNFAMNEKDLSKKVLKKIDSIDDIPQGSAWREKVNILMNSSKVKDMFKLMENAAHYDKDRDINLHFLIGNSEGSWQLGKKTHFSNGKFSFSPKYDITVSVGRRNVNYSNSQFESVMCHELGHGVMSVLYKGKMPPVDYGSDNSHYYSETTTASTALVEGWAEFFEAYAGSYSKGYISHRNAPDYMLQNKGSVKDMMNCEVQNAAIFYDLVNSGLLGDDKEVLKELLDIMAKNKPQSLAEILKIYIKRKPELKMKIVMILDRNLLFKYKPEEVLPFLKDDPDYKKYLKIREKLVATRRGRYIYSILLNEDGAERFKYFVDKDLMTELDNFVNSKPTVMNINVEKNKKKGFFARIWDFFFGDNDNKETKKTSVKKVKKYDKALIKYNKIDLKTTNNRLNYKNSNFNKKSVKTKSIMNNDF